MPSSRTDWQGGLGRWLEPFLERLGHKTRRGMCPLYIAGLIGPGDRKSVAPVAWIAIDAIEAAGWVKVGYRRHARHGARQERQPYLNISWTEEVEDAIRAKLQRPRKVASYASRWRSLVADNGRLLSEAAVARIQSSPIEVPGRPIEDVFSRLLSIRRLVNEPLLLREVSSRTFWGLSKLLDGRGEVIAALVGADECPFPEQPIVLNVHLPSAPLAFLFIENHVAFERLKRKPHLGDIALIYCAGFRAASLRLRSRNGCSIYYTRDSRPDAMMPFEKGLFSDSAVPTFFWGDLDYAGMAILASLRSAFPTATAWQTGYAPMVERCEMERVILLWKAAKSGNVPSSGLAARMPTVCLFLP